jgi:5'-methylthioadenosine phosphorylase
MSTTILGVIGGSGFYQMSPIKGLERVELSTPFGAPSDAFHRGTIGDVELVFLARHGKGHRILPSEINFRANIYGMKVLGVEHLVSVSAAGSMKEEIAPGDLVIPDQFIDRTYKRPSTFFGNGIVAHVSLADPVCPDLSSDLAAAGRGAKAKIHQGGTYLCIEGPQFSTRAESQFYRRSIQVDVISMTAMQEARLAREAEFCYATLALVTDYDCWHQSQKEVDIGDILRVLNQNVAVAQQTIVALAERLGHRDRKCNCEHALKDAIITDRGLIPPKVAADLRPIIGKYVG